MPTLPRRIINPQLGRPARSYRLKGESGAVLLMLLVMVTLIGLLAGMAGSTWSSLVQQSKEADLLWKGSQIRKAIGSYYETAHAKGAPRGYPRDLEVLVRDPRFTSVKRHLRQPYLDPMTKEIWEPIPAPGGGIMGVRSLSEKTPFKQDGFREENKDFAGRQKYSEWQFIYKPQKKAGAKKTGPLSESLVPRKPGEVRPPTSPMGTSPFQKEESQP